MLTWGGVKNPNNVVDIICELPLRAKIVFRPRDRLSGGVENRERVGVFPGPVFTSLSLIISEGLFLLICCYWYFRENLQKYIISWKMFLVTPCFPGKQILLNGVNMSLENPLPCPLQESLFPGNTSLGPFTNDVCQFLLFLTHSPLSVPESRKLPSFGQILDNPLPPSQPTLFLNDPFLEVNFPWWSQLKVTRGEKREKNAVAFVWHVRNG